MARIEGPARLAALRATGLLDAPAEPAFDRLTRLVTRLLGTPVAAVSLVDDHRQFFKSAVGLPEPWAARRETPLSHSFCKHVVETEEPLVVDDAKGNALVCENLAIPDLGVAAYLGVPLVANGHVMGALCAIDGQPRHWTPEDLETVRELAAAVVTEIELRAAVSALREQAAVFESVLQSMDDAVVVLTEDGSLPVYNAAAKRLLGERTAWPGQVRLFDSTGTHPIAAERDPLARAVRGTSSLNLDLVLRKGEFADDRRADVDAHPVRDATGKVVAGVAVFRDTTDRRAAESELRASEERFRLLAENSSDLIRVLSTERRMLYVSPASEQLLGYLPHEVIELPREMLLLEEERPPARRDLAARHGHRRAQCTAPPPHAHEDRRGPLVRDHLAPGRRQRRQRHHHAQRLARRHLPRRGRGRLGRA